MPAGQRAHLLRGNSAVMLTQDEILQRMGLSSETLRHFRGLYRLLSAQVHSTPLAFYRVGEERGRGLENSADKNQIALGIEAAAECLRLATKDMLGTFPDIPEALRAHREAAGKSH